MLNPLLRHRAVVALILLWWTVPSLARFDHRDADEVDQEQNLGKEIYLDRLGYRLPDQMRYSFTDATTGLLVSAGSLDAYQFDYEEQLKFGFPNGGPLRIRYHRTKTQDVLATNVTNDLRLEGHWRPFYLALIFSGDGVKKWGDIGVAVGAENPGQSGLEVYYLNVDVYYPSKEREENDAYPEGPWTIGLNQYYNFGDARLLFSSEYDRPMTWQRTSHAYRYHYEARKTKLSLQLPAGKFFFTRLIWEDAAKKEGKEFTDAGSPRVKTMIRRHQQAEASITWRHLSGSETAMGLQRIIRQVDYTLAGSLPSPDDYLTTGARKPETFFSPDTDRGEWLWFLYHDWLLSPHTTLRLGYLQSDLFVDQEFVPEEARYEQGTLKNSTEQKFLTAFWITPRTDLSLYLNAGWNIDRLIDHFPYGEKPFRPWNGGQLAVQLSM